MKGARRLCIMLPQEALSKWSNFWSTPGRPRIHTAQRCMTWHRVMQCCGYCVKISHVAVSAPTRQRSARLECSCHWSSYKFI